MFYPVFRNTYLTHFCSCFFPCFYFSRCHYTSACRSHTCVWSCFCPLRFDPFSHHRLANHFHADCSYNRLRPSITFSPEIHDDERILPSSIQPLLITEEAQRGLLQL